MKKFYDTIFFGITTLLISAFLVYGITGVVSYKLITPNNFLGYLKFVIIWILFSIVAKLIITAIYKSITKENSIEYYKSELYGRSHRPLWGGRYGGYVNKEDKRYFNLLEDRIKQLKSCTTEDCAEEIKELQLERSNLKKNIVTGSTIFEGLFCIRKLLKKRLY